MSENIKQNINTSKNIFATGGKVCGFTLVEVLVTLGIFAVVMALALGVGFDTLTRSNAQAERDLVVHLLQKARARAMANMHESEHRFEIFEVGGADYYKLWYDDPVTGSPVEEVTPIGGGATVSGSGDGSIPFVQLSGNVDATESFSITSNSSSYVVEIEDNGRINW